MRLVSTVELMTLREQCQNLVGPFDKPVTEETFAIVKKFAIQFRGWYDRWDKQFEQKNPDRGRSTILSLLYNCWLTQVLEVSFYRQSLEIQYLVAELFHNATILTTIKSVADVPNMHQGQMGHCVEDHRRWRSVHEYLPFGSVLQRELTKRCAPHLLVFESYLRIGGLAVHYTHATAAFVASLLLRCAKLL